MWLLILALLPAQDAANRKTDALMRKVVDSKGPGAGVLVIRKGRIVFERGYGLANLEHNVPITPRTVFELASVSKQFTAMAIMILAERRKLRLEDDVRNVLPELRLAPEKRPIRILDLLHHTSGIKDYLDLLEEAPEDPDRMKNEGVLTLLARTKLVFRPGAKFAYSNSNYCLLALIVERITKKSFGRFLRESIFSPLGMKDSIVFDDAAMVIPRLAYGYDKGRNGYHTERSDLVMTGDGCVRTSLRDFARWDDALRKNKLVKPAMMKRAFTNGTLDSGKRHEYGFGWSVDRDQGRKYVTHSGGWAGASTFVVRYLREELTVVVLSNLESFESEGAGSDIAEFYLEGNDK